jgi:nicotinamide-nucleotide amidase
MGSSGSPAKASILACGEELIGGRRSDTNSTFLQQRLRRLGFTIRECRQVGDDAGDIAAALRELAARNDLVVITGGLGPTEDDRTREAAALAAGVALEESALGWEQVQRIFARAGRTPSPSNRRQALLPRGAGVLANDFGSAPGFTLSLGACRVAALPGVPREMQAMTEAVLLPWLLESFETHSAFEDRPLQVVGLAESVAGERIAPWMASPEPPAVAITAHEATLTITLTDRADAAGRRRLDAAIEAMSARLAPHLFAVGETRLEECVLRLLLARGRTLGVAESCTGGEICAALTSVAGASAVLLEGCVAYANQAKIVRLGVDQGTLERHGAVSEEVARAMAEGMRRQARSDYALAVTGVAGPGGGTEHKPVGTVWIACASGRATSAFHHRFLGDREAIRRRAAALALDVLRRELLEHEVLGGRG